jgi:FHA domain
VTGHAIVTPGSGLALVLGPFTIVASAETDQVRREIWAASTEGSIDAVLAAMLLEGRPRATTFGIIHDEGDQHRIFLRGDVHVEVTTEAGIQSLEGADLRTWSEHVVEGVATITARLTGETAYDESFDQFVECGLVGAVACVRPTSASSTSARPESGSIPTSSEPSVPAQPESEQAEVPGEPEAADVSLENGEVSVEEAELTDDEAASGVDSTGDRDPDADEAHVPDRAPIDPVVSTSETSDTPMEDEASAVAGESDSSADDYSHMFGDTRHRSVLDASVDDPNSEPASEASSVAETPPVDPPRPLDATWSSRGFEGQPDSSAPDAPDDQADEPMGDHDGNTLSVAEARRLRAERGGEVPIAAPASAAGTATVQALVCDCGHANPPYDAACRRCGAELNGVPVVIPRPVLGRLRFSTGDEVVLDRPLIIGRKPDAEGRRFSDIPKTVKLDVRELSRSHAVVHLEGWQVRVEDLGSLNHTTVTLHGRQPQRLREGEPMLITDRAVIDLGGEVECVYDANP